MSIEYSASPTAALRGLITHRDLIWQLSKRDFVGRYKGSLIGVLWSLFHPLLMLAVYTVVFSVAFKAKWGVGEESKVSFAIVLFSGMIVHALFAECLNRAPTLIISHANYVKKVVFPLEILPWVVLISALLHFVVSLFVLVLFCLAIGLSLHLSVILVPVAIAPLTLLVLGMTWMFASLGVYLRDIAQGMGVITTVALFLSPVFYPMEALPEAYHQFILMNPITLPISQLRDVLLLGKGIDWAAWSLSAAIGLVISCVGFWWFQKTRRGFADVL